MTGLKKELMQPNSTNFTSSSSVARTRTLIEKFLESFLNSALNVVQITGSRKELMKPSNTKQEKKTAQDGRFSFQVNSASKNSISHHKNLKYLVSRPPLLL